MSGLELLPDLPSDVPLHGADAAEAVVVAVGGVRTGGSHSVLLEASTDVKAAEREEETGHQGRDHSSTTWTVRCIEEVELTAQPILVPLEPHLWLRH